MTNFKTKTPGDLLERVLGSIIEKETGTPLGPLSREERANQTLRLYLWHAVRVLGPKYEGVISHRYGFGTTSKTLQRTAQECAGLFRGNEIAHKELIRQYEKKAIRLIRYGNRYTTKFDHCRPKELIEQLELLRMFSSNDEFLAELKKRVRSDKES